MNDWFCNQLFYLQLHFWIIPFAGCENAGEVDPGGWGGWDNCGWGLQFGGGD